MRLRRQASHLTLLWAILGVRSATICLHEPQMLTRPVPGARKLGLSPGPRNGHERRGTRGRGSSRRTRRRRVRAAGRFHRPARFKGISHRSSGLAFRSTTLIEMNRLVWVMSAIHSFPAGPQGPVPRWDEGDGEGAASGTDQRNGVNFDQQEGSAVGGRPAWGEIGAHAHVARHVTKSAESNRTRNWAWQGLERTGRSGVRAG